MGPAEVGTSLQGWMPVCLGRVPRALGSLGGGEAQASGEFAPPVVGTQAGSATAQRVGRFSGWHSYQNTARSQRLIINWSPVSRSPRTNRAIKRASPVSLTAPPAPRGWATSQGLLLSPGAGQAVWGGPQGRRWHPRHSGQGLFGPGRHQSGRLLAKGSLPAPPSLSCPDTWQSCLPPQLPTAADLYANSGQGFDINESSGMFQRSPQAVPAAARGRLPRAAHGAPGLVPIGLWARRCPP